ncbi:NADH:flavin oxidoreductase/NADH oxidase family protein [Acinetobacter sp. NIPH 1852]|uniref:NADH:flavin oxidoreductase/NADH oxidase family protein n=1 Tax=Acinetobacter sp. NIPH 1852 TaxID=2923428 RepID=UPI001F4A7FC4|nr:NADH:flavin oxidoreductase/NADH oxidase family protein [Acinetobacter sp. NIPH 1852]MCH7307166.1 NADH:flavin oxidoreductase/NADH oxidase family protein [Acinetobacter sp. NIPH 1852]
MKQSQTKQLSPLQQPLKLACGISIPNRIVKSAMSEQLADRHGSPTTDLQQLYAAWARGGTGLLITGNVMIDHRAFVEPRNVVLEDEKFLQANRLWAQAAQANGSKIMMQINHPGRVAVLPLLKKPIAPSAVGLDLPMMSVIRMPRAMSESEILEQIQRFANTAALAIKAGFDGVQIHAAHGYLLSQFLSPLSNIRTDQWGGNPENRRRMLIETVRAVRQEIGKNKILSVKLNSADFQKGGLSQEESIKIALALEAEGIDLLEISGGNYESPAQLGYASDRSVQRDAYFLDYATELRKQSKLLIMLTGGLRDADFMNRIVADGTVDLIGLARPFALQPDLAKQLLAGKSVKESATIPHLGYKPVDAYLQLAWHSAQFRRISGGQQPRAIKGLIKTLIAFGPRMGFNILTQG